MFCFFCWGVQKVLLEDLGSYSSFEKLSGSRGGLGFAFQNCRKHFKNKISKRPRKRKAQNGQKSTKQNHPKTNKNILKKLFKHPIQTISKQQKSHPKQGTGEDGGQCAGPTGRVNRFTFAKCTAVDCGCFRKVVCE